MLKFLILLTVAAVSCATDLDDVIGAAVPMAVSPPPGKGTPTCANYIVKKTDITCTCKGRILPVAQLTRGEPNVIQVLPIVVRTDEDAAAAMDIKFEDCTCPGDYNPEVGVIKIVNDNYFITYVSRDDGKEKMAVLNRRRVDTRADFDAVIEAIGFDKQDYAVLCNDFTETLHARLTIKGARHAIMYEESN